MHTVPIIVVTTLFFGSLAAGVPIFLSLGFVGLLGVVLIEGMPGFAFTSLQLIESIWHFGWLAGPVYILMGTIMLSSGIGERLFDAMQKWMGRLPGGLPMAVTASCVLLGTICGSAMAACATVGPISIPTMRKYGYSESITVGINASAGGLASIIPPSNNMVVISVISGISLGRLFFAGFGPGLMLATLFSIYLFIRGVLTPNDAPRGPSYPWRERFLSMAAIIPVVLVFVAIFGAIYTGKATPTEAGAVGCLGMVILVAAYRKMSWSVLMRSLQSTVRITCFILLIIIGGYMISYFFFISGAHAALRETVLGWNAPPVVVLTGMIIILTLLGMFLESASMYLITIPFFLPIVVSMGIDPVLFGIILILEGEVAQITPPVGSNLFVIQAVSGVSLMRISWGALPYVAMITIGVYALFYLPQIALWLPSTMWQK